MQECMFKPLRDFLIDRCVHFKAASDWCVFRHINTAVWNKKISINSLLWPLMPSRKLTTSFDTTRKILPPDFPPVSSARIAHPHLHNAVLPLPTYLRDGSESLSFWIFQRLRRRPAAVPEPASIRLALKRPAKDRTIYTGPIVRTHRGGGGGGGGGLSSSASYSFYLLVLLVLHTWAIKNRDSTMRRNSNTPQWGLGQRALESVSKAQGLMLVSLWFFSFV